MQFSRTIVSYTYSIQIIVSHNKFEGEIMLIKIPEANLYIRGHICVLRVLTLERPLHHFLYHFDFAMAVLVWKTPFYHFICKYCITVSRL